MAGPSQTQAGVEHSVFREAGTFFFPFLFLISGLVPFAGARGAEHPGLERGRAWEGRELWLQPCGKESVFVLMFACTCRPKPLTNTVSFTLPTWGRGHAGAQGAAFRAFQPPDS